MNFSSLYTKALALMPHLPARPIHQQLYVGFAVAGDAFGTYHLLAHYDIESLLYVKVVVEERFVTIADLRFTRSTDDLSFFGADMLGTLWMQSPPERYDFDFFRNNIYRLFRSLADLEPNATCKVPDAFAATACLHNNGPACVNLLQSLRRRREPESALPAGSARYAY